MENKPTVGLALGSGSSRGWAHIGVIKTLVENGIEPDYICGASIGALVGASYATGRMDLLEAWACNLSRLDVAGFFEINTEFNGFVNKDRLHRFLNEFVCDDTLMIDALDKHFSAVATDLATGTEVWLSQGALIEAVWASISIPGLFPAIRHDEHWLVDGGLVNPVPVSACRSMGADVVIAVNLNGDIAGKHFRKPVPQSAPIPQSENWVDALTRRVRDYSDTLFNNHDADTPNAPGLFDSIAGAINITQDRITRYRIAADPPDFLITPAVSEVGLLEFFRARELVEAGCDAVNAALPDIRQVICNGAAQPR